MRRIKKITWCLLILTVLLMMPLSVSAKTGKGINIKKTFAKGTSVELSRKKYDRNKDGYLSRVIENRMGRVF